MVTRTYDPPPRLTRAYAPAHGLPLWELMHDLLPAYGLGASDFLLRFVVNPARRRLTLERIVRDDQGRWMVDKRRMEAVTRRTLLTISRADMTKLLHAAEPFDLTR